MKPNDVYIGESSVKVRIVEVSASKVIYTYLHCRRDGRATYEQASLNRKQFEAYFSKAK